MNILHLSRTMGQGGAQKIVYQLAVGGKQRGHHVIVVSGGGVYETVLMEQGINHVTVTDLECKNASVIWNTLSTLISLIRKEKIEIIHSHHRMAALYASIIKIFYPKIQLIYTAHNVFYSKKRLTKFALRNHYIVAVGQNVRDNLCDYFSVRDEMVSVIYNAVTVSNDRKVDVQLAALKQAGFVLTGFVGRLAEQKGVDVYIRALEIARKMNPYLKGIIIGDGPLRQYVERMIHDLYMEDCIILKGYQSNIISMIEQLDFVVMPSRWEGFPLIPMEVFLANRTLIASNIGGIDELVKHNENGVLVSKDDVEGFAEAILNLADDPCFRKKLEHNGSRFARQFMDQDRFVEQYMILYRKLTE